MLLGFARTWLMVPPLPLLAPVMPPVSVPIVHAKVLGTLDVSEIFGLVLLQIATVGGLVTAGLGFTVTVIVYGAPGHTPVEELGVTMYWTVPALVVLGLTRVWLIVPPLPALAPVIPPVTVPTVHVNVLGTLEVSVRLVLELLQMAVVTGLVTAGVGFTVTV
jgi:hypothetical protein